MVATVVCRTQPHEQRCSLPSRLVLPIAVLLSFVFLLLLAHPAAAQDPIIIPFPPDAPPLALDGSCRSVTGAPEYAGGFSATFADVFGTDGVLFMRQTATDLWVCIEGIAGTNTARYDAVYLDTDDGMEAQAQEEDLQLKIAISSGMTETLKGTGSGGYTAAASSAWTARRAATPNVESAEWRISKRLAAPICTHSFGIGVMRHDVVDVDDYGWPAGIAYDVPRTWESVRFAVDDCNADLQMTKTDSKDPVVVGEVFTYTLVVKNNGPDAAEDVKVTDSLPAGIDFVSYTAQPAGPTCAFAAPTVTCSLGSMDAGAEVQIQLQVKALTAGDKSNTASVTSTITPDSLPNNNSDTERTRVNEAAGRIAYVLRSDDVTANDFKVLLEANAYTVQIIPLGIVLATDFGDFDLILIAEDTGDLGQWPHGVGGASPEANHIRSYGVPVIGLGEGGYAYLGKHGSPIGWPQGWHGPLDRVSPVNVGHPVWHTRYDFGAAPADPLALYAGPSNEVGIFLTGNPGAFPYAVEPGSDTHAPLVAERDECNQLWGFSDGPARMTDDAKSLFVNMVDFGITRDCRVPQQPPITCVQLVKEANPPSGTAVSINSVIAYTIRYQIADDARCATERAELQDAIPVGTIFVPGSAGPGVAPGGDGVLRWNVGPLAPGASGQRSFRVIVMDAICNLGPRVHNIARLATAYGAFLSNATDHPVECPPAVPAGTQPPYAEDEIQIYPYPLVTGQVTGLSVRVRNLSSETVRVRVTFETSPNNFGIGIPFGPLPAVGNPRILTLPPAGEVGSVFEVKLDWIPVVSGHYCLRVKIEHLPAPGQPAFEPIYTYRNLDVMENLQPGVTDTLTFSVGNPTGSIADVVLVVENTCPGWSVVVNPPVLEDMAPGEVRTATLSVVPPTDRPLGTTCHIDVQGWIGDQLIGGIRKLDVPPVHLPPANPPWEEREIVFKPDPPVIGVAGQLCIQLNNPMPFPRTVSVDFEWAAFGAGIGFTPAGTINNIVLPPTSFTEHCVPWTPVAVPGGSVHRCILVTLRQEGFADQHSQRNVDVRRIRLPRFSDILLVEVPFTIGNPEPYSQTLDLNLMLLGLDQGFVIPKIMPDPPPDLGPGEQFQGMLTFQPGLLLPASEVAAQSGPGAAAALDEAPHPFTHGDSFGVEVAVLLNGELESGFSVEFEAPTQRAFLPLVNRFE